MPTADSLFRRKKELPTTGQRDNSPLYACHTSGLIRGYYVELGASCLFLFSFVLMGVVVGPYNIRQGETDPNLPLGGVLWQVS